MAKSRVKKVFGIVTNILLGMFLAICMFAIIITALSKQNADGAASIFGYQLFIVQSNSMEKSELTDTSTYKIKEIKTRSCILVETVPNDDKAKAEWYSHLEIGDVLTFKYVYTKQVTITHRITDIQPKSTGGYLITLEGDNKTTDTSLLTQVIDTSKTDSPNYIIGKVRGQSYVLGLLISALKSPIGIILIIIIPSLIIIILQVMRIVNVYGKDKYKKQQEEIRRQAKEIEKLKQQTKEIEQLRRKTIEIEELKQQLKASE